MKLTQADVHALENLLALAKNAFRSKVVLKQLSSLQDRGLIEFDPMAGSAAITGAGRSLLASSRMGGQS